MILIADSGSTKTDWAVVQQGTLQRTVTTCGINPFFQTEEDIAAEVENALLPLLDSNEAIEHVFFYGAGCTPEKIPGVKSALTRTLHPTQEVEVYSDMVAVARSLCGHQPGIACILGTGSNSCSYDGKEMVQNVSPLGFILGDEGSGAVLGKLLVGDLLKNQTSPDLKEEFLKQYQLTPADVIDRVYRQPFPNRFLASLSPFLLQHIGHSHIRQLVRGSFEAFFRRNVMQYDYQHLPIHFTGSVAYHYQEVLHEVAHSLGLRIATIHQSPLNGLVSYHQQS